MSRNYLEMRSGMMIAVVLWSLSASSSASPVACLEDSHCYQGSFCETSEKVCRECLSCEDLKREPPRSLLEGRDCIKFVQECGPCLKGWVVNWQGDLKCVPPTDEDLASSTNSTNMWVLVGVIVVLLLVAAAILLICMWRNRLKFQTDTRVDTSPPSSSYPSAPKFPPPEFQPPEFPPPYYRPSQREPPQPAEDMFRPLIKADLPKFSPGGDASESSDFQNANPFNPPSYVRLNDQNNPPLEVNTDLNDNYPPSLHDERTTESLWTPEPSNSNSTEAASATLSSALALARATDLIQVQPPAKRRLTRTPSDDMEVHSDNETPENARGSSSRPSQYIKNVVKLNIQVNQQ